MSTTRVFLMMLALSGVLPAAGCLSEPPPEGIPIDFEAQREFKPFKMRTLEGDLVTLDDFMGRATLVAFFFPT